MNSFSPSVILRHIWSWAAVEVVLTVELEDGASHYRHRGSRVRWQSWNIVNETLQHAKRPCYVLGAFIFFLFFFYSFSDSTTRHVVPELDNFHHPVNNLGNVIRLQLSNVHDLRTLRGKLRGCQASNPASLSKETCRPLMVKWKVDETWCNQHTFQVMFQSAWCEQYGAMHCLTDWLISGWGRYEWSCRFSHCFIFQSGLNSMREVD